MSKFCTNCGAQLEDNAKFCTACGAPVNGTENPSAPSQPMYYDGTTDPRTIEELKIWYTAHNLPPQEVTRFFIGQNIRGPRAFGIYRDGSGNYVVYKNKDDGSRAVRYQGPDEAYAVRELHMRLAQEIFHQKETNKAARKVLTEKEKKAQRRLSFLIGIVVAVCIGVAAWLAINEPYRGYYHCGNDYYYYQSGDWYWYNSGWYLVDTPDFAWRDYYTTDDYSYSYGIDSFEDSDYYSEPSDSNSSTWSSGDSWSSDSTNWSSDW